MTGPTRADMLVAEMGYLFGAKFFVTDGPGEPRWHYEATPHLQDAARAFLLGLDRHHNGSFDHEMVEAIRRLEAGEGRS